MPTCPPGCQCQVGHWHNPRQLPGMLTFRLIFQTPSSNQILRAYSARWGGPSPPGQPRKRLEGPEGARWPTGRLGR